MAKQMKVVLSPVYDDPFKDDHYKVVQLVNTMRCRVGESLTAHEVQSMMRQPNLTVVIQQKKGG